ncbi:UDP-N-acetylglucosamine 2-epimerase (non-hydrolyzing) [Bacillus hwajinpoensis]|uniref:UDP-N-acetylglucosamine 2-epimerase (non-hydrolyzing) n=1 Tax=Guptibacillus hwajinpoensis TaxID=208199 RepID=A0A845ENK7_9BACL|nr:UDP-N-acetylglucosamine 2-epimerase (non-hydrolyzing) [Pseudalkalibacillus hwajinpoensis]MYL61981.1 UDP-N-acetylglucosamine 2-epimerase (non-hydrolyzing) [Pseudalkalibacillus hwajinpoensis]
MAPVKVMSVFGTRPEAIKMAPLVNELKKYPQHITPLVAVTAQHREMLDQVLSIFEIDPDYDLNIMKSKQSLADITTRVLNGLDTIMKEEKPDLVLVHGDTTTTFAASLAAFYNQISVGHVEAGLRSYDKWSPFPEEMNRMLTGNLADLHFAPTIQASENLLNEGKKADRIYITGNTAIDALKNTVQEDYDHPLLSKIKGKRIILLTSHRRENHGEPMTRIFQAVKRIVNEHEDVHVVFPVHLNPLIRELADKVLGTHSRVHLIEPLDVIDFHNFASKATLILTDSGGVQEEAPSLGSPVLVLRENTERPEGVSAGTLKLVGTDEEAIYSTASTLLTNEEEYHKMSQAANPYGDGEASNRIVKAILYYFGASTIKPDPFTK